MTTTELGVWTSGWTDTHVWPGSCQPSAPRRTRLTRSRPDVRRTPYRLVNRPDQMNQSSSSERSTRPSGLPPCTSAAPFIRIAGTTRLLALPRAAPRGTPIGIASPLRSAELTVSSLRQTSYYIEPLNLASTLSTSSGRSTDIEKSLMGTTLTGRFNSRNRTTSQSSIVSSGVRPATEAYLASVSPLYA